MFNKKLLLHNDDSKTKPNKLSTITNIINIIIRSLKLIASLYSRKIDF